MAFGPNLTPAQRKQLQAEIAAFDKKETLAEIERNAVGRKDVNAYEEWLDTEGGGFDSNDPDNYSDEAVQAQWGQPLEKTADMEIFLARFYEALTPRQLKIWKLVMVESMSQSEAAFKLRITESAVSKQLRVARGKMLALKAGD